MREHWRIENGLHRVRDVIFEEDQSRLRGGHGAQNTAGVRHFALNLVRLRRGTRSIRTMRKLVGRDTAELARVHNLAPH